MAYYIIIYITMFQKIFVALINFISIGILITNAQNVLNIKIKSVLLENIIYINFHKYYYII